MRTRVLVLLALALAIPATSAEAATTVGVISSADNGFAAGNTVFPVVVPVQGPTFLTPAGVITGWQARIKGSSAGSATIKLKVARSPASPTRSVVAEAAQSVNVTTATQDVAFPARISVQAGDLIGLYAPSPATATLDTGATSFGTGSASGDVFGGPFTLGATVIGRLNLSATVEPDADGDGYGDETQDACPADPALHTAPCSTDITTTVAATPTPVSAGGAATLVVTARTTNALSAASAATATITVPAGLEVLTAVSATGECTGTSTVTCPLGDVGPKSSRTAVVVVRATGAGSFPVSATVQASNPDANPADNAASTALQVTAATAGAGSTAAPKLCTVPRLKGATLSAARSKLTKAGCAAGKATGAKGRKARVQRQAIPAGVRVAAGTKVALTLATPKPTKR